MPSTSSAKMEEPPSAKMEEPPFPCPSRVNVEDSVTIKLCPTNYFEWKQLMLSFLESYKLSGFVDGTINPRKRPTPLLLEERQEKEQATRENKRQEDWNQQHMQGKTQSLGNWVPDREMTPITNRGDWEESLGKWEQEWQRRQKWGWERSRRRERNEQIYKGWFGWKRSDELVRGWILATVTEEILLQVGHLETAREVWIELEKILAPPLSHLELIDWEDQERMQIVSQYEVLYKAALTADWAAANRFLDLEPNAVCEPITWCLETALIVAVRSAKRNHVVKELIQRMSLEGLVAQDISGATALHAAVDGGNIDAAKWLVYKNPELANIEDKYGTLPVHVAADLGNREMVDFLFERTSYLFEHESGLKLLHSLASSGLYDIALTFLQQHRNLASIKPSPLVVLAGKPTSFLSGTNFNLLERLIYSVIPLKLEDIANRPPERDIGDHTQEGDIANHPPKRDIEDHTQEGDIANHPPERDIENQEREIETQDMDTETQERDIANDPPEPENPTQEREIENPCKCYECCCRCLVFALIHVKRKLCSVVRVHCFQKLTALFWDVAEKFVPPIKSIRETKLNHVQALKLVKCLTVEVAKETELWSATEIFRETLSKATCMGIKEIVEEIWDSFPSAKHLICEKYQSLFHLAIAYRWENVFNLIYQMEESPHVILSMRDVSTNNALHLAGNLRPQQQILLRASVDGAALQMQRELQWFEEVGNFMVSKAKKQKNVDGKTPQELFTETHKNLVKEGEQWMKDTANSCSIVAALITTIVFAAAITVPGGSFSDSGSDKKGLPIRLGGRAFTVFGVSDALAMFSSSASLLMFLSILTCRYGEEDFRYSLPRRLIIGLVSLFLSIISMMVAFGATLKIVFGEKTAWLLYPVAALSCAPVALFALWQFPLLYAMIKSTYFPGIFGKKSNRILH